MAKRTNNDAQNTKQAKDRAIQCH